jgi:hypothetical protein
MIIDDNWAFPLDQLQLEISGHAEDKIMIRCTGDSAVLLFDQSAVLDLLLNKGDQELQNRCKFVQNKLKGRKAKELKYWSTIAAIFAAVLLSGYLAFNVFIDWAAWHLDPKLETAIGKSASKYARWDTKSPQLTRLNRIGDKLASKLGSSAFLFSFNVKKVKEINAAAYPGGIIEVNQGLLDCASDDELAGIIGHEMGHVLHHDTLRRFLHDMGGKSVLLIIGGAGSDNFEKIADALSVAQSLDSIRFSRSQESDADIVGVDLAIKSGYDGEGLIHFFERLEKITGKDNKMLALLSDHPLDSERIESVKKEIERLKSTKYKENFR